MLLQDNGLEYTSLQMSQLMVNIKMTKFHMEKLTFNNVDLHWLQSGY